MIIWTIYQWCDDESRENETNSLYVAMEVISFWLKGSGERSVGCIASLCMLTLLCLGILYHNSITLSISPKAAGLGLSGNLSLILGPVTF